MTEITIIYAGSMEEIIMNNLTLLDVQKMVLSNIPKDVMTYLNEQSKPVKIIVFAINGPYQIEIG
jgi:hypothetical protein